MKELIKNNEYDDTFLEIKSIILNARQRIYSNINSEMVLAYWNIGKIITEKQGNKERAEYGEKLVAELSNFLTSEFGKGFDTSNLIRMRKFYLVFKKDGAVPHKLSWTHFVKIITIEEDKKREFYINECIVNNWSTRQLIRQINSFYYERILATQKGLRDDVRNEIKTLEEVVKPDDIIKSPYVLEFLDLKENAKFYEKDLESNLIEHLEEFLLELGKGFCFIARQKRISFDGRNFYIDLVFYNFILKCFVLIDLKMGELTHQDLGQMQMYVNYYTREMMNEGDNPPIGIVLCSDKSETVVKYTLSEENKQIYASKYKTYLPTEEELIREIENEKRVIENNKEN